MARVACIMMQKNEGELLRTWIEYYRHLFGEHNLFIFDNGSTDELTLNILRKYQDSGISINRAHKETDAHIRKDVIFGAMIRSLDRARHFDFFIPVDCDEFLILRDQPDSITTSPEKIHTELQSLLGCDQAFGIDTAYYNILGQPNHFFDWPQRKTFFKAGTFGWMDSGFHEGTSILAPGKLETKFAHIHYHHKPYDALVEHSKNKLRPFFDPEDENQLRDPKNKNRLTEFILQGEAAYMQKFMTKSGIHLPQMGAYLREIGLSTPFHDPERPPN